jgi:hypothetical protein
MSNTTTQVNRQSSDNATVYHYTDEHCTKKQTVNAFVDFSQPDTSVHLNSDGESHMYIG